MFHKCFLALTVYDADQYRPSVQKALRDRTYKTCHLSFASTVMLRTTKHDYAQANSANIFRGGGANEWLQLVVPNN